MKITQKLISLLGVSISSLCLAGCTEVDYYDAPPPVTVTPASSSVPQYGPPPAANSSPYYGRPTSPPVSVTPNGSTPNYGAPQDNSTPHYGPASSNSNPYYGHTAQVVPAQAAPNPGVVAVVKTSDMKKHLFSNKPSTTFSADRVNPLPDVK